jgi:hypothetical protein
MVFEILGYFLFKGAAPRFFGEYWFVLTIIHVIKLLFEYIPQKEEDKYRTAKEY